MVNIAGDEPTCTAAAHCQSPKALLSRWAELGLGLNLSTDAACAALARQGACRFLHLWSHGLSAAQPRSAPMLWLIELAASISCAEVGSRPPPPPNLGLNVLDQPLSDDLQLLAVLAGGLLLIPGTYCSEPAR